MNGLEDSSSRVAAGCVVHLAFQVMVGMGVRARSSDLVGLGALVEAQPLPDISAWCGAGVRVAVRYDRD